MVCIIMWISHECLKKLRDFELKSFLENLRISKKVPTREFHGISRRVKTVKSFHWHPIWQWSQKSILGLLSNRSDRERDARIQSLNSNERIYYVHYVQLNISVRTSHTLRYIPGKLTSPVIRRLFWIGRLARIMRLGSGLLFAILIWPKQKISNGQPSNGVVGGIRQL